MVKEKIPAAAKSFVKAAENPDDLEGTITPQAEGDPDTLVRRDNPDDVDINRIVNDPS